MTKNPSKPELPHGVAPRPEALASAQAALKGKRLRQPGRGEGRIPVGAVCAGEGRGRGPTGTGGSGGAGPGGSRYAREGPAWQASGSGATSALFSPARPRRGPDGGGSSGGSGSGSGGGGGGRGKGRAQPRRALPASAPRDISALS